MTPTCVRCGRPMHPHQLRATAALWALRAALDTLESHAALEARVIAEKTAAYAEPLRSPLWGRRNALGGHSDPTADAADTIRDTPTNRWAELWHETNQQLRHVANELQPAGIRPLDRFETAIPTMSERAANATRTLLDRTDARIRRLLHEPDDRQLIPRIRCPTCDTTSLVTRTTAPPARQIIECTTCDAAWWRTTILGNTAA